MTLTLPIVFALGFANVPLLWGLGAASYWWPNVPRVEGYRAQLHYAGLTVKNAAGMAHTLPVRFGAPSAVAQPSVAATAPRSAMSRRRIIGRGT